MCLVVSQLRVQSPQLKIYCVSQASSKQLSRNVTIDCGHSVDGSPVVGVARSPAPSERLYGLRGAAATYTASNGIGSTTYATVLLLLLRYRLVDFKARLSVPIL